MIRSTLHRYELLILVVIALVHGALYLALVPPWQHPDEPTHFEQIAMIAETHTLPTGNDVSLPIRRQIADSMLKNNFWRGTTPPTLDDKSLSTPYNSPLGVYTMSQPRLYYILAAAWLTPWLGQPVDVQLAAVRALSILLSVLVVICCYITARLLFPAHAFMVTAATLFLVFLPGYTDIMSAANNDALVNALGAILFLALAWLMMRRHRWWAVVPGMLFVALVVGVAVESKATALELVAALPAGVVAVAVVQFVFFSSGHRRMRAALLGLVVLAMLAGLGIFLILPNITPQDLVLVQDWLARYVRANIPGTLRNLTNPQRVPYSLAIDIVFRSFWAIFGWRHVYLAPIWYWVPTLATLAAVAGLIITGIRTLSQGNLQTMAESKRRMILCLVFGFVIVAIAWVAAILRSQADQGPAAYQSHGRYAYIAIVPFALLFVCGLLGSLPVAWRQRGTVVFAVTVVLFDAICFWGFLVPYYH